MHKKWGDKLASLKYKKKGGYIMAKYKTDCFAFKRTDRCIALTTMKCEGCSFYKTVEQYEADKRKSEKRLVYQGVK